MMDPVTLQSTVVTWPADQDLGTPGTDPLMPGFAQAIGTNGFYVHAGGSDIWNAADAAHFVYQSVPGDYDVAVRVAGLSRPSDWSKAGLMVREELDPGSRHFMILAAPTDGQNLINMQWRTDKDTAAASIADAQRPRPSQIPNSWMRATRTNQTFAFYYGTNGIDWVSLYTTNLAATPYPSSVYVGMATTSHDNGTNLADTTGAYYQNLTGLPVSVPARLTIKMVDASHAAISWTSGEAALQLQFSDAAKPVNWQAVGITPVQNGSTYTVTVSLTSQPRYFRLLKP
jgi:regulation of enolase protein 1 (concanavalin A-like superfamily)